MEKELTVKDLDKLTRYDMNDAVKNGIIRIMQIGELPKHEYDTSGVLIFQHLAQNEISISDAAKKYNLPASTVTRWMQRGIIPSLRSDGYRTWLDEQYVAWAVSEYKKSGPGKQGRKTFSRTKAP